MTPKAKHLVGGNYFDDIRIDIQQSILNQEKWLQNIKKESVRKSAFSNYIDLVWYGLAKKLHFHDFLIVSSLNRTWFKEFYKYWTESLEGRPIEVPDFFQLQFLYRTKLQINYEMSWSDSDQHLKNWQVPVNIGSTFNFVRKYAFRPMAFRYLHKFLRKDMRVLEYGCGVAPIYKTWKTFWNHINIEWVLADIPNFPFHYARHIYGKDRVVEFACITEDLFDDPLKNVDGDFDFIIIQEAFEHLDHPRFIAEYLLQRLNKGGFFYFDYINSGEPVGLDTPGGASERTATLSYLNDHLDICFGDFKINEHSVGVCVGKKK